MEIRKTQPGDLDAVMALYEAARTFMHQNGNPNQWINGYPQRDLIAREMTEGHSHVCIEDGEIVAVFSLILGEDPTYRIIREGTWLDERPYGVVHRICTGKQGAGVGAYCLDWCLAQCGNLRIDTHRDNRPMQALLKKCGFTYCGLINLADGSERMAYQKILQY